MTQEDTTVEDNYSDDETITTSEETTTEEEEQDDNVITLTKTELEERERAIRKEQDKRWKDRIKSQKADESTQEDNREGVATKEEMDRFRLESKGVEDKTTQDFVLKYANLEGMTIQEALQDEIVQAKLSKMNAEAERVRATGSPFNRTSRPREKTPEELARLAETGKIASSKEDRKKALTALQSKYGRT